MAEARQRTPKVEAANLKRARLSLPPLRRHINACNRSRSSSAPAGQADRQDHWASNYQNTAAYRDANYGYTANYVDQSDYNYYFRQGVQRGYADEYNSQLQYGTTSNGTYSILASVLSSILELQPIE